MVCIEHPKEEPMETMEDVENAILEYASQFIGEASSKELRYNIQSGINGILLRAMDAGIIRSSEEMPPVHAYIRSELVCKWCRRPLPNHQPDPSAALIMIGGEKLDEYCQSCLEKYNELEKLLCSF